MTLIMDVYHKAVAKADRKVDYRLPIELRILNLGCSQTDKGFGNLIYMEA